MSLSCLLSNGNNISSACADIYQAIKRKLFIFNSIQSMESYMICMFKLKKKMILCMQPNFYNYYKVILIS